MSVRRAQVIAILLTLIAGCASAPTAEKLANADYGDYPANYRQLIRDFFQVALKDPDSAQYQFREPYKGYSKKALIVGGGVDKYGWICNVNVNAKNSYGGYTGSK